MFIFKHEALDISNNKETEDAATSRINYVVNVTNFDLQAEGATYHDDPTRVSLHAHTLGKAILLAQQMNTCIC